VGQWRRTKAISRRAPLPPADAVVMRAIVLYYSRTGCTRRIAEEVASRLGCDIEAIVPKRGFMGMIGWLRAGRSAMKGMAVELEPLARDPTGYDLVVVGTPVWGGTVSSVVRAVLVQNAGRLGRVAFLVTSGGPKTERTLEVMQGLCGRPPVATLCVLSRDVKRGGFAAAVDGFVARLRDAPA
jgi:hypothetical protein